MNVSNVGPRPSALGRVSLIALVGLAAGVALGGLGCQNDTSCAEDGTPCGGDPTGSWTLTGACRDPAFAAPVQSTYLGQPVAQARQPVAPTTSSDWCSSVAVNAQGLSAFVFPHDTLAVSGADSQITYAGDGTYQAVIHTAGQGEIDLSASCLQRFGVAVTCDALAAELSDYAARQRTMPSFTCTDSPDEPASCAYYYTYSGIQCADNGSQGCACRYGVNFAGTFTGKWSIGRHATGALRREEDVADPGRLLRGRRWQHALVVGARSDVVVRRARFANAEAAKDALICQ